MAGIFSADRFKRLAATAHRHPLVLLILAGVAIFVLVQIASSARGCRTTREVFTVQGSSMEGIFSGGDEVLALHNFYHCNEIQRDDAVLFTFSGNPNPLLKVVRAIPGDRFGLIAGEQGTHILVNGQQLRNAQGRLYTLNEQRARLLGLYVHDYKGVIPKDAYLILGNISGGSMDSTQFGLVLRSSIIAKVVAR
jgi:signal peptidase I